MAEREDLEVGKLCVCSQRGSRVRRGVPKG